MSEPVPHAGTAFPAPARRSLEERPGARRSLVVPSTDRTTLDERMAKKDRKRGKDAVRGRPQPSDELPKDLHGARASTAGLGRRRRGLGLVAASVMLVLAGVLVRSRFGPDATPGAGPSAPAAEPASATPVDPIQAELLAVAEKLFATPGGWMDRTRSAVLRRTLPTLARDARRDLLARCELVDVLLKEGKEAEAVAEVEELFRRLATHPGVLENEPNFHRLRGKAYLRLAEVQNCLARHNRECCVFPLKDGGVHGDASPAREATASYLAYLAKRPGDLSARWIVNILAMAQGAHPAGVPREHWIPTSGPTSNDLFPRFRDVAQAVGITRRNHAGGCVVDDVDGDGLLDVVLTSCAPDAPMALYRNRGDGTFEDRTEESGLEHQLGALNLVSTDHDGDGDLDLFVLRGAWMFDEGCIRNSLLRNEGDGTFVDVTSAAGLAFPACPTQVAVWLDYDNDGDLDVFVGNESRADRTTFPPEPDGRGSYPSNLFRNEGDGTFVDVAREAGVTNDRFAKGATAGDYDGDGWIDLYVSNVGKNRLYRNDRDGTFTDVAEELGVVEPAGRSFAPWFFDFDGDGHLDLYVSAYEIVADDVAAWYLRRPFQSAPPRLYRNKGDGTFEDVTRAVGLWRPLQPMGANFGDLDNDGWLDVYLSTGNPDYEALVPNVMLRNVGGLRFEDVTFAGGFGNLQKGHGVAFADVDDDGDQDVFNELGGFFQGDLYYDSLYENPGNANRFVTLELVGTRSNRLAYGARVRVDVETPSGARSIHRAVGSVSSFGGSPARQEIGLGDATAIRSVEVWWPTSGTRQTLAGLELDAFYEITEGAPAARKLERKPFALARD